jgi:hypothetical protein
VGTPTGDDSQHALLWSGTAASCIDLTPSGYSMTSVAYGVSDGQQVGSARGHAALWSGTAESYVDLNPSGFRESLAYGVSNGQQVGWGWRDAIGSSEHALLWSGTAESYVDLSTFLPAAYSGSRAFGIDSAGNIVGEAWGDTGIAQAVLWQHEPGEWLPGGGVNQVPLPGAALLGAIGLSVAGWRLRRRTD